MSGRRHLMDEPEVDEFGPGSDLVLSMFSVTVLMLAIVGVGSRWVEKPPQAPPVTTQAEVDALKNERDSLRKKRDSLQKEGESLKAERDDLIAKLAKETRRADENGKVATDLGKLNANLAELAGSKGNGRGSMLVRRTEGREVVLAEDTAGAESFVPGTDQLTPIGRERLNRQLGRVAAAIGTTETNVLLIEARESIEPRPRAAGRPPGDGALDLSAARALTVAQILAAEYRLPLDCLSIQARGRSRSELLFRRDSALPLSGNTLSDLDAFFAGGAKAGAQSSVPQILKAIDPQLRRDRVVVALAAYDPGVPGCTAERLKAALPAR